MRDLEERMFLAADIRDELLESGVPYGEANRIAWDTIGPAAATREHA